MLCRCRHEQADADRRRHVPLASGWALRLFVVGKSAARFTGLVEIVSAVLIRALIGVSAKDVDCWHFEAIKIVMGELEQKLGRVLTVLFVNLWKHLDPNTQHWLEVVAIAVGAVSFTVTVVTYRGYAFGNRQ